MTVASVYTPIYQIDAKCNGAKYRLAELANLSFDGCLHRCDARGRRGGVPCMTVAYNFVTHHCKLLRECMERAATKYGQCKFGYMLQPKNKLGAWLARHKAKRPDLDFCHYTRGSTSATSTSIRRRENLESTRREAHERLSDLERRHPNATICAAPLLRAHEAGEVIGPTHSKVWRYYTAIECGNATRRRICLLFKKMGNAALLGGIMSDDGVRFGNHSILLRLPAPWREGMLTHNLAALRLGGDEYAMLGGLQGFVSNDTCRKETGLSRASCLQLDRREPKAEAAAVVDDGDASPMNGIRLTRGRGLPWNSSRWTTPRTIITGDSPSGCVDRRPHFTGYPRLRACQFDGRLSLARGSDGRFLLYARANLRFGAVSGGRYVQVTHSEQLERGWAAWQPVQLLGADPNAMDLYFFAVQASPVDRSSFFALFPLTEPPFACIAFAVSLDGIRFSRPVNLLQSSVGFRRAHWRSGLEHSALEFRGEDHPVAGAVLSPSDPNVVLVYVHHAVKGTSVRTTAKSHVRVYRMAAADIRRETTRGLRELRAAGR